MCNQHDHKVATSSNVVFVIKIIHLHSLLHADTDTLVTFMKTMYKNVIQIFILQICGGLLHLASSYSVPECSDE
jgi:hypothetical protein